MNDDYLWDRGGEPDRTVTDLEVKLSSLRWTGKPMSIVTRWLSQLCYASALSHCYFMSWCLRGHHGCSQQTELNPCQFDEGKRLRLPDRPGPSCNQTK